METYYWRFRPTLALGLYGGVPTILALNVRDFFAGQTARDTAIAIGAQVIMSIPFWAALLLACIRLFPVKVGPAGVRSYTFWCTPRTIPWASIAHAAPFRMLGISYIRVYSIDGGWPIWIPTWLKNPTRFRTAVEQLTGDDNPLRRALVA